MASSAFLVIRCLRELAEKIVETPFLPIREILIEDFYVDDLLTGADSAEGLLSLYRDLSHVLRSGCFELRKWVSNNAEFLNVIKSDESSITNLVLGSTEDHKALGLFWNPKEDVLFFTVTLTLKNAQTTKRQVLSTIAQIFDPLGFLAPVTTIVKIIIQKLWQLKLSWDESIPSNLRTQWLSLRDSLTDLNSIKIPRHVLAVNSIDVQLHAFCDASEAAYGACVYIRSNDKFSNCTVRLLASKARVAPLKTISIPRLELCGALVLSQLVNKLRRVLKINFSSCHYWTDSTITLDWIRACPSKWKTFVANRVSEIHENLKTGDWHHVAGVENPADLLSRGLQPAELVNSKLWWSGPHWLTKSENEWPVNNIDDELISNEAIHERRTVALISVDGPDFDLFGKFSSFAKLRRVTAYVLRFAKNARVPKQARLTGPLDSKEIHSSTAALVKLAQCDSFSREIAQLEKGQKLHIKSSLLSLSPFLEDDLLRVGGRLKHSDYGYSKKHPILLPKNHALTSLIIKHEHERLLHAGPQAVLAALRDSYWPITGRSQVKQIVRKCVRCCRANPRSLSTYMSDLPASRLTPSRVFSHCGVDYAGPFSIKDRRTRGAKITKGYICLFICFATKAIHLELVGDLTTEAFIAALRRFSSRRGKPTNIFSDNGTNFVGANRELSELSSFLKDNEESIINKAINFDIRWHFIPPRSPHFGGLWESGVKSVKTHLKKILFNAQLNYEDFNTILIQIEGCLNSRPISPMSDDPNDFQPLTPAHFLIGESLSSIPDPSVTHIAENRLSRYQRMQQLIQNFWTRWSREYISELQRRSKWKTKEESPLKPGSLVIIKEDNIAPVHWKMGRIIELHDGKDGVARVATVRTATGISKRATVKLCLLPITEDDVESTKKTTEI